MNKRIPKIILLALLLASLIVTLCGCDDPERNMPYVTVQTGMYRWNAVRIDIGDEYALKDYDRELSEDELIITLRFQREEVIDGCRRPPDAP